jgi:cephalosporin hydroxylase
MIFLIIKKTRKTKKDLDLRNNSDLIGLMNISVIDYYKEHTPDINEHLDTLTEYAKKCDHITEFGFRFGASFCALLLGAPKKLITYDIDIPKAPVEVFRSLNPSTKMVFIESSTLIVDIEETDLLFIDTLHTYEQLKAELDLHGNKARKYLAFHDTTTFRHTGEHGGSKGLYDAILEFLELNPHWELEVEYNNNNGLLILRRADGPG